MPYKHNSSAANRLAKQLEFFIARNDISITDSMSLSEADSITIIRFYKNHKHKVEKHNIAYDNKAIIKLLKDFYDEARWTGDFRNNEDSDANNRVGLRKLLRILPITDPRFKPLINNIKRNKHRVPRIKQNDPNFQKRLARFYESMVTRDEDEPLTGQ